MSRFLSGIFRWLGWKVGILIFILSVFIAGAWLKGELKKSGDLTVDRAGLIALKAELEAQRNSAASDVATQLQQAKAKAQTLRSLIDRKQRTRDSLWNSSPLQRYLPMTDVFKQIKVLDAEIATLRLTQRKTGDLTDSATRKIQELNNQLTREHDKIDAQVSAIDEAVNKGFLPRILKLVYRELPAALALLVAVILTPIVIKLFFYFVVAPLATGRRPIRIFESTSGTIRSLAVDGVSADRGRMSAVSLPIVLAHNEELLIQPDFLQSTSIHARKDTRWLLNSSFPFASVLSGMFMLTRVGPDREEPIVISATKDSLSEVGILDLGEGAAFVCQPRSLVGVIQDAQHPVRITRHWRLGSLQSWLTLQLRFLAFHGPARLVLKGCRGVRIECAGNGRLINQAATLGFSANIEYANTRCETFVSYWSGKEDLFNDLFTGQDGVYVYEEMPDLKRSSGVTGRGLEGISDTLLKVFGV